MPLALVAACGQPPAPSWIALTEHVEVTRPAATHELPHPWAPGREARLVVDAHEATLHLAIGAEDWRFAPEQGCWFVPLVLALPPGLVADTLRLTTSAGPVPSARPRAVAVPGAEGFAFHGNTLVLAGTADAPPGAASVSCGVPAPGHDGRFELGTLSGRGVALLPGDRASARVAWPAGAVLRFATRVKPLVGTGRGGEAQTLRIRLDGEVLFEREQAGTAPPELEWHAVRLPDEARSGAQLALEFEGGLAHGLFLDPVIGPAEIGTRSARPWPAPRADIVVVVADTFRADNLAAYGGEPGIAPHLDRLARESRCYLRAWSTSTWTLPAHASLLTGYFPPQVLSSPRGGKLPQAVETVTERLSAAGYRTAAITGGGFVAAQFGLAQGFDLFHERAGDLEGALAEARAWLDADDGRPLFLLLHTYRTHWPYHVSPARRALVGARLGIRGEAGDVLAELLHAAGSEGGSPTTRLQDLEDVSLSPRVQTLARELRAHYLGGVADLDHELGAFLDHLRSGGLLESGYLVFTSDHGEAFGEHAAFFHDRVPYEEQVRVPLLVAGRGIAAETRVDPVSWIDLAPTFAQMAALPAAPDWPGTALSARAAETPVYGFEFSRRVPGHTFVLADGRKVLVPADGPPALEAYDLYRDPGEHEDAAAAGARWPAALYEAHAPALECWATPVVPGESLEIDAAKADELRALGY